MVEIWNEQTLEKAYAILKELRNYGNFVLIGGWATYFITHTAKSKDIDIFIDFSDFFELQKKLLEGGKAVRYNSNLNKYEVVFDEIEIDIYTPESKTFVIPPKDIFANKWHSNIEGFECVLPEVLIVLKLQAEKERSHSIKGLKDRVDMLSLLFKAEIDYEFLNKLFATYRKALKARLIGLVSNPSNELKYIYNKPNLRDIKKRKLEILKKLG